MNTQLLIVGIIILAAAGYAGLQIWNKARTFSTKKSCGTDCGCGPKTKTVTKLVKN